MWSTTGGNGRQLVKIDPERIASSEPMEHAQKMVEVN